MLRALAESLAQNGNTAEAENAVLSWLEQNEERRPVEELARATKLLGAVRHQRQDVKGAAAAFKTATELAPTDAEAWAALGLMLAGLDETEQAIDALHHAVTHDPMHLAARKNLALAQMKMQRTEDAALHYRELCQREPDDPANWVWLGHAAAILGQLQVAYDAYAKALDIDPNNLNVSLTMALIERDLGDFEHSTTRLVGLYAAAPSNAVAAFVLAQNYLQQGDFKNGFALYERRWERPGMARPSFAAPQWTGQDLAGKTITIFDEQGLGDTFQFARFISVVEAQGAKIRLHVRPKLRAVLSNLAGAQETDFVATLTEEDENGDPSDFHCPLMSLPFGLSIASATDIPHSTPYLAPDDDLVEYWREKLHPEFSKPGLKVGLIWQGDPQSQSEKGRSPPSAALRPLIQNNGVQFFLLQKYVGREDLSPFEGRNNVTDLGDCLDLGPNAFVDTAAVMTLLDAVVTSDTGPAHLAGALGVRTGVLLKKVPEWRWGIRGTSTPWYPSMTLFRQKHLGDWNDPVQQGIAWLDTLAHKIE